MYFYIVINIKGVEMKGFIFIFHIISLIVTIYEYFFFVFLSSLHSGTTKQLMFWAKYNKLTFYVLLMLQSQTEEEGKKKLGIIVLGRMVLECYELLNAKEYSNDGGNHFQIFFFCSSLSNES